jgi:N,N'-diacetylbacillosaminyl-diphospho-undecaprenol alpha-1,3-N-acetylgalactosaminyltransferase
MHIVFIDNNAETIWLFRRDLILTLLHNGHCVTVIVPDGTFVERVRLLGVEVLIVPLHRFINPVRDICLLWKYYRILRKLKPVIVYTMTVKPNVFGTIAARCCGIKNIYSLVAGLGTAFTEGKGWKRVLIRFFVKSLYRFGGLCVQKTLFLNKDDHDFFITHKILPLRKSYVVKSEGVNLNDYSTTSDNNSQIREEFCISMNAVVVTMIARVNKSKGTIIFRDAAKQLENNSCNTFFLLVGPLEKDGFDTVSIEEIRPTSNFRWIGYRSDIREIISMSDIVVLPSYYREGVPRTLLEAMAMRKPIVTTNHVGCRECVEHEQTGLLIPTKSSESLSAAIKQLVTLPELRKQYGNAGFQKVKCEFSIEYINKKIINEFFEIKDIEIPDIKTNEFENQITIFINNQNILQNNFTTNFISVQKIRKVA